MANPFSPSKFKASDMFGVSRDNENGILSDQTFFACPIACFCLQVADMQKELEELQPQLVETAAENIQMMKV